MKDVIETIRRKLKTLGDCARGSNSKECHLIVRKQDCVQPFSARDTNHGAGRSHEDRVPEQQPERLATLVGVAETAGMIAHTAHCRSQIGESAGGTDIQGVDKPAVNLLLRDRALAEKLRRAVLDDHIQDLAELEAEKEQQRLLAELERSNVEAYDLETQLAMFENNATSEPCENIQVLKQKLESVDQLQAVIQLRQKAVEEKLEAKYREHRWEVAELLKKICEALIEDKVICDDDFAGGDRTWLDLDQEHTADTDIPVLQPAFVTPTIDLDKSSSESAAEESDAAQQMTRSVVHQYQSMKIRLCVKENNFENRAERFELEELERARKMEAGEEIESGHAFDMRQLNDTRKLVRELTEAEEAFEAAKAAAVSAGVQAPGSDVESGFVDDGGDDYGASSEADVDALVNVGRMHRWLEAIPSIGVGEEGGHDESIDHSAELDDWEARSVEMCDSLSVLAYGSNKRRIKKWQAICAAVKL